MRRTLGIVALGCALAFGVGVLVTHFLDRSKPESLPDGPAVILQMREVARLETLDVTLFKRIAFVPDPSPAESFWGDVRNWAKFTLFPSHGRAIVFADVHLGLPLEKLDADHVHISGSKVQVVLPPPVITVSLRPADTEVISSNLDSAQTAQLLELARRAFEQEAMGDLRMRERARHSAERSLGGLLRSLGFREVEFVDKLPARGGTL